MKSKEEKEGQIVRVCEEARTPLAQELVSPDMTEETKRQLEVKKAQLIPFAVQFEAARRLKEIAGIQQIWP